MSLRVKNQDYGECFFITTSFLKHKPLGDMPGVYEILAKAVNYQISETVAKLAAYVFMPTHLHLMLYVGGTTLPDFMRDFKKFTAQKELSHLCNSKRAWQARYDRQAIWSEEVFLTKVNYIHYNPVRAGLCLEPEQWYWSSAADYAGRSDGPIRLWREWLF